MQNIPDWRQALAEIARVVKRDGAVLVALGNPPADEVSSGVSRHYLKALRDAGAHRIGVAAESTGRRTTGGAVAMRAWDPNRRAYMTSTGRAPTRHHLPGEGRDLLVIAQRGVGRSRSGLLAGLPRANRDCSTTVASEVLRGRPGATYPVPPWPAHGTSWRRCTQDRTWLSALQPP
jgi:hypothetical protein